MKRILLIATVATLAFAGGAYGAAKITGAQIKDGTITGADIKNRSITAADFRGSVEGPQGPAGPVGPQGPAGPSVVGKLVRVQGPQFTIGAGQINGTTVTCPPGLNVVSGGYRSVSAGGEIFSNDSFGAPNSWSVALDNFDSTLSGWVMAIAYCAQSGQAVATSARPSSGKTQLEAAIAAQRELRAQSK